MHQKKMYICNSVQRNAALDYVVMNFDGPTASFFDPDNTFSPSAPAPAISSAMVDAQPGKDDEIPF